MIHRGQTRNVTDQFVQQRRLYQVSLLRDEWFLSQDNLFRRSWVGWQQSPVDVASVSQVRIVTVL